MTNDIATDTDTRPFPQAHYDSPLHKYGCSWCDNGERARRERRAYMERVGLTIHD